jgi:aryl-alcohol dehydrogenase-like predicted oxidoreductase
MGHNPGIPTPRPPISPHIVSIPGTKRRKYLEQNVAIEDIQFTADELKRLDTISQSVVGARY